ncbi:MAG: glutathione S-transferase [Hyphomicrobiales bacterium]|nr:glutathione S-transferase [Hyphomicrobiales bacterium]MCP4999742.1 glutathione S-transferase [Hyphomicrobiales bacterium]
MLTVLGRRSSANVQKVAWLLAELELPHRHIELGGTFGGLDTPEFRMMNPHGKVPVIKDGEHVVWESHAILRYLAAKYGAERFWSDDPAARSRIDQWMDWSQVTLQNDFLNGVFWGYYRTPEEQRDMPAVEKSIAKCATHFALLDSMLKENDFLLGDALSLADFVIGTHMYRCFNLGIDWPEMSGLEAYYARLQERSAYAENVMVPFDELFGRLSF